MTQCTPTPLALHGLGTRPVIASFDGGTLTSDAGGLRLREVETRSRFREPCARCVTDHRAPEPDTVRGNMYLVVLAGWLPDTGDKSYDRIQRLLNRLRENGTVPFRWVVDNVRQTIKPSSWSGLSDFTETVRDAYRLDFWSRLPEYVEIIVEKDTIAGKLAPVTPEYDVPLRTALRRRLTVAGLSPRSSRAAR